MTKKELQNKPQIVLSHMAINSFIEVTIPQTTKSITINENYITDFVGLNSLPKLEYFCADKNPIISFRGFPSLPNLTNLSLIDTPISKLPNFRALAVVVAGQQLKTLNGIEVSTNDRAAALAYGPPETTCQLIIRGWLPKKPVSLPARKSRNNTDNTTTIKNRILQIVDDQEKDPVSVRITRVLRAQGYGIPQIREFLLGFFAPHTPKKKEPKQLKEDSSIEAQVKKQQQIIDVLAAQLHALRSGNRTFNDYDEMIRTSGSNLLKNAEILNQLENNENNDQNYTQDSNQNTNQNSEFSASKTKKKNKPEYELLRSAVIDFLQVAEDTKDNVLIQLLDSVGMQDIQEEEEEDYQNPETNEILSKVKYYQSIKDDASNNNKNNDENRNDNDDENNNNENNNYDNDNNNNKNYNEGINNNEFTEDEISQFDEDTIPRPITKKIIADIDDKNENNSQVEVTVEEEETSNDEEDELIQYDDGEVLNDTIDRGINVPEAYTNANNAGQAKDVDEDVKKILDKMEKMIDEEDSQTDNDSVQPNDNNQLSS